MTKLTNFNLTKIKFLKPKRNNLMYISKVLYNNNDINIQLKRKITASGVYREGNKYYLDLIFDSENVNDTNFITLYKQLEMSSIKEIYKKYNEWMKTDNKLEWEDVYTSFNSHLSDENTIKKIKFNILTKENMMGTTFYDESLEKISYKEVEEGDEISLIIYFNGIKFGKENFDNQWEILQIKKYNLESDTESIEKKKSQEKLKGKFHEECQIDIDSDEDDDFYNEDSINLEDLENLEKMIESNYNKFNEEESLKIIS